MSRNDANLADKEMKCALHYAIVVIGYNNVQKYVYSTLFVATRIRSRDILIRWIYFKAVEELLYPICSESSFQYNHICRQGQYLLFKQWICLSGYIRTGVAVETNNTFTEFTGMFHDYRHDVGQRQGPTTIIEAVNGFHSYAPSTQLKSIES